jgi:hypothetical protein
MPTQETGMPYWFNELDARQQSEVRFAREYADRYSHGTDGHNRLLLLARLADLLDERQLYIVQMNASDDECCDDNCVCGHER